MLQKSSEVQDVENSLVFRSALPSDMDFAWGLWSDAVRPHVSRFLEANLNRAWSDEEELKRFGKWWHPSRVTIFSFSATPVGWLGVEETLNSTILHNFCVASDVRRRGYGAKALEIFLLDWEKRDKPILHSVLKDRQLLAFFQKFGFKQIFEDDLTFLLQKVRSDGVG